MSITNAELKDIKSLRTKKGRKQKKRFLVEGIRVLEEALRYRVIPELICAAPSLLSDRGRNLADRFEKQTVRVENLTAQRLASLSDTREPQGIIGVFEQRTTELSEPEAESPRKILLLDGVADPGNLGTLFRSALAFDFRRVILVGRCADAYAPKVVRSTAGAVFGLSIAVATETEAVRFLSGRSYRLIGADGGGKCLDRELSDCISSDRIALAIGSEAFGLSDEVRNSCAVLVRIDHVTGVESLNAAVAGSILMKQIYDLS